MGARGWVRKVKGVTSKIGQSQNSHGDATYSMGNGVNNTAITTYGTRWILKIPGDHIVKYMVV